jgi:hypothetical protein
LNQREGKRGSRSQSWVENTNMPECTQEIDYLQSINMINTCRKVPSLVNFFYMTTFCIAFCCRDCWMQQHGEGWYNLHHPQPGVQPVHHHCADQAEGHLLCQVRNLKKLIAVITTKRQILQVIINIARAWESGRGEGRRQVDMLPLLARKWG